MADLQRLEEALRNADAAGDAEAASALAAEIRRARSTQPASAPQGGGIRGLIAGENSRSLGAPVSADRSTGEEILRKAQLGAKGFNDSVAGTLGALPDAAAWGINKVGQAFGAKEPLVSDPVGGSDFWKRTFRTVGKPEGELYKSLNINVGGETPETTTEKFIYGAGKGVGDAASIALPSAAIANIARPGTMTQAVAQTLASQPVLQGVSGAVGGGVGEATDNPLLGIAASLAVPLGYAAARKMVTPTTIRLDDQERAIVAAAKSEGIPLNIEQQTGNKTVAAINSVLRKLPFSSDLAQNADDATRQAFNRAVLRRAGVNANAATPEVLDDAFRLAGQSFDDLVAKTPQIALAKPFFDKVDDVVASYGRRLPSNVATVFQSFVDDIGAAKTAANQPGATVSIDSATYKRIYSDMARVMRGSNDRELVSAVGQLKNALDDAMTAAVPKELASDWKDVRKAYAALTTISRAMAKAPQGAEASGNIPFGAFRNEVRRGDPIRYARGRGDLNQLARIGGYLADKVPDSGTAQRSLIQSALTGGGVGSGVGAAMGNPILGAVAGLAGPPVAYGALNNPVTRGWLTNQMLPGSGVDAGAMGGILSGRTLEQIKQILEQQP